MFDFLLEFTEFTVPRWYNLTYSVVTLSVCLFSIYYFKNLEIRQKNGWMGSVLFLIFFIVFAIGYCINSDYFNYRRWVEYATKWFLGSNSQILYQRIAYWCNGNYNLFRLLIWGGGLVLVYISCLLLRIRPLSALLILFCFFNTYYCYARASLAMSVFFFGLSIFLTSRKEAYLRRCLGILITISSIYFHNEMILPVLCLPFLWVSFTNKKIWIYIICAVLAFWVAFSMMRNNLSVLGEFYSEKISAYEEQMSLGEMTWQKRNWHGAIQAYAGYFIFVIWIYLISKKMISNGQASLIPRHILYLYRICIGLFIVSITFFFVYGSETVFFYRMLFVLQIPLSLIISYLTENKIMETRWVRLMLLYAVAFHSIRFISLLGQ